MFFIYNILVGLASGILRLVAIFNPKMKLFVEGRRDVFQKISNAISTNDKTIWFHAASLGEYEQGLPVILKLKELYPSHKIVLTFFSPSGYEVRKDNSVADVTVYLPMDSTKNAEKFIDQVHPEMVFFIKYEFWPNYLNTLYERKVPTYLISGIFRESQPFFKWYGGFYRKALRAFEHFFVQNDSSKKLLVSLGFTNVTVSGDTRFDRVVQILEQDNTLDYISKFTDGKLTIVIGSSWPSDEKLLVNYINNTSYDVKFIIAPHNIKSDQISDLRKSLTKDVVLFSEKDGVSLEQKQVFIIDTVGLLTKIYSYADIAYVGGGFGNPGVHNVLEPATFGIPIIVGPNFSHFAEAIALVNMRGAVSIKNQLELNDALDNLITNDDIRFEQGSVCETFVQMNKDATKKIIDGVLICNRLN